MAPGTELVFPLFSNLKFLNGKFILRYWFFHLLGHAVKGDLCNFWLKIF
jgi:hypothetical protein